MALFYGSPHRARLALTRVQVERYDLPVIIKRDRRYCDGRPHRAVETEPLSQTLLVDILRRRLDKLLPEPLAAVVQEREERERRSMRTVIERSRQRHRR
jgi:hypothetical protein